jgi:hypothetical protein
MIGLVRLALRTFDSVVIDAEHGLAPGRGRGGVASMPMF